MPPGCIAVADAMGVTDAEYLAIFCVHGSSTAEWLVSSPMV
jgi:hypothetical protein